MFSCNFALCALDTSNACFFIYNSWTISTWSNNFFFLFFFVYLCSLILSKCVCAIKFILERWFKILGHELQFPCRTFPRLFFRWKVDSVFFSFQIFKILSNVVFCFMFDIWSNWLTHTFLNTFDVLGIYDIIKFQLFLYASYNWSEHLLY